MAFGLHLDARAPRAALRSVLVAGAAALALAVAPPLAQAQHPAQNAPADKNITAQVQKEPLVAMPSLDAFFDPEPRLELMKEMGIDRTLLWPTLASALEERMANDPDAVCAVIHALNEWMHEHWS